MARAWLIDLYDTAVEFDVAHLWRDAAAAAEVPADAFRSAADEHAVAVMTGAMPLTAAIAATCAVLGRPARAAAVEMAWRAATPAAVRLPADVVPFLLRCRAASAPVALVSNCADDTPAVLDATGLRGVVDAVVLSYEVGVAKPDAAIFHHAVAALGVDPADAVLVDDQPSYCAGALAAGLRAVRIDRQGIAPAGPIRVVRSFDELG